MNKLMYTLGHSISSLIENFFYPLQILPFTIYSIITGNKEKGKNFQSLFFLEVYKNGVQSILIVFLSGALTGYLVFILFPFNKISFGIQNIKGSIFVNFILRELSPFITSLLVIIRSSVSITVKLIQMKFEGEIDTLEIMGINPVQYLGSVIIYVGIVIIPILSVYFSLAALVSGLLTAFFYYKMPFVEYLKEINDSISILDLFVLFIKTAFAGLSIFIIAIYNGLSCPNDRTVITNRIIRTIITSIFAVLIFNLFISAVFYAK